MRGDGDTSNTTTATTTTTYELSELRDLRSSDLDTGPYEFLSNSVPSSSCTARCAAVDPPHERAVPPAQPVARAPTESSPL